MIPLNGT
ncbi:hypothetical protein A2U01_0095859, partial [Trifolium medium]|nr:hypothetical protein [Trifolium medium]